MTPNALHSSGLFQLHHRGSTRFTGGLHPLFPSGTAISGDTMGTTLEAGYSFSGVLWGYLSCVMPQGCEGRSLNQKSEFFLTYKSAWRTLSCTVENTPFSSPWYRHPKTQGIHGGEDSFSHTRSTSVLLCPCLPPLNSQQVL